MRRSAKSISSAQGSKQRKAQERRAVEAAARNRDLRRRQSSNRYPVLPIRFDIEEIVTITLRKHNNEEQQTQLAHAAQRAAKSLGAR